MSKIWKNIVVEIQEEVKVTSSEVYASLDFGAYIAPQDCFMPYIFETGGALDRIRKIGLLQKISNYHKQLLRKKEYPEEDVKDCTSASQEDYDEGYNGN